MERGNDGSQAGIMFRESVEPQAKMVFLGARPMPGLSWQARKEPKAGATGTGETTFTAPCWLKLARAGNTVTASASKDGVTWKQIGTETIAFSPKLEAGLAVSAHQTGATATGKLEVIRLGK